MTKRIMISAGEASGDMHAANIVNALNKMNDSLEFYGMGSTNLRKANMDIIIDCADIAVVGLFEVLIHYRKIMRALNTMREMLRNNPPDLLILVDYQEFNFKLAQTAKALGIKVLFYVSPQVWAWRQHRVHKIGKVIDMMAVILPFEEKFYQDANVPVRFVGNPLTDETRPNKDKASCFSEYELDENKTVIGLFPGSRRGEIQRVLPIQLEAAVKLVAQKPELQFIIPIASTLDREIFIPHLSKYPQLNIKLVKDLPYNVMQCCDSIIIASGTATLEVALMGIPSCITYRISPLSYFILKRMVTIEHIGLVNIVAERGIVKEFIQHEAQPQDIADEIIRTLDDGEYRIKMVNELNAVKDKLGKTGGIDNMAELVLEMLE